MTRISKNILLISGSGRNVGKTSFITRVIRNNASKQMAVIKITPHFHEPTPGLVPIALNENYRIFQETNRSSEKDSSVFLKAGAEKVFFIQVTDSYLEEAFKIISVQLAPEMPLIVESAALRKFVMPGLYLFIQKRNQIMKSTAVEMHKMADLIVFSEDSQFSFNPELLIFNQIWKTEHHDYA